MYHFVAPPKTINDQFTAMLLTRKLCLFGSSIETVKGALGRF